MKWHRFKDKNPAIGKNIAVTNFDGPSMIGFIFYGKELPLYIEMHNDSFTKIESIEYVTHWCYISDLIEPSCLCK